MTSFRQVPTGSKERRGVGLTGVWSLMVCIMVIVLGGCGGTDSEEDRQFANDPTQQDRPTDDVVPSAVPEPASPVAELPPADTLLKSRGAASIVYAIFKGSILVLRPDAPPTEPFQIVPPTGQSFLKVTSSPSGDRVAAMLIPIDGAGAPESSAALTIYDPEGATLQTWNDVVTFGSSGPTPAAGGNPDSASGVRMEWSPRGDQILITAGRNELVTVPLEGEPTPIPVPDGISLIEDAQWSPRGDRIALLAKGGDGPPGVQLFTPNADPSDLRQVIPPDQGTIPFPTIEQFAWLPDGSGIVYILADERTGSPGDGQLFVLDLATGRHRLVATPGQGGPSASIVSFALSPDGKAVAYVIATPDRGAWAFHSLWVRSLRDSRALRLPVADVLEVNAIWWTSRGLLWGQAVQTNGSGTTETFVVQAPASDPMELASMEVVAAAPATPAASPAGSPAASAQSSASSASKMFLTAWILRSSSSIELTVDGLSAILLDGTTDAIVPASSTGVPPSSAVGG